MKMQIAFRETSQERHGHNVAIAGGVIEVGPDEMLDFDEKALAFRFAFVPSLDHPVAVVPVAAPRDIVDEWGEVGNTLQVGTIEDFLTSKVSRAMPNDQHNADFILRETELPPSEDGAVVFAFSGLLHLKPRQPFDFGSLLWFENVVGEPQHRMIFAGRSGIEKRPEDGSLDMVERMRGHSMPELLRLPLWGFGPVAYGLPGTMRIENYQRLDRYQQLSFQDDRTPEEDDELQELRGFMRHAGLHTLELDETFGRYLRRLREEHPEFTGHRPMTADQIITREQSASVLLRAILEEEDGPSFSR